MAKMDDGTSLLGGIRPLKARHSSGPKWPVLVGGISIFFGGMPILGLLVALVSWAGGGRPFGDLAIQQYWVKIVLMVAGVYANGMFLLLFLAGLGLVRRRPWGRTLHLAFGWIVVGVFLLSMGLWFLYYPFGGYMDPQYSVHTWQWVKGWASCLWYPSFLLFWFYRPSIREKVKCW
jgi:hypothetical protein